jgi:hypothetical protein
MTLSEFDDFADRLILVGRLREVSLRSHYAAEEIRRLKINSATADDLCRQLQMAQDSAFRLGVQIRTAAQAAATEVES